MNGLAFKKADLTDDIGSAHITSINRLRNGGRVISTIDKGCFIIDREGKTVILNEERGISSNTCLTTFHDSQSRLWIGTNLGVDVIPLNQGGVVDTNQILHLNSSRGFTGSETNAINEDLYGNIWFSTVNGGIKFPKSSTLPASVLPILRITGLNLLLKDIDWKNEKIKVNPYTGLPDNLILPYNNNHVTFNFEGAFLSAPDEVEYQYILENFDENWSPASTRPVAIYSNLNAGTYTFKVKCSTNGRDWTNPVVYSFTIKPPFWKTTFFYILYFVTAIVLVFAFLKIRTRNLEKKRNVLQGLVDERTQELNEKNQELEKLSIVASETDNAVLIFDARGTVEWVNEGFTKLTGYSLDEMLQLYGNQLSSFTFNPKAEELLIACVAKQQSDTFESSIICKDGQKKWVSHTLTPVFSTQGNLQKTIVIATDITLRKNMEEQIRESLDEKGLLLREIHHRVKNNLQIIISLFNLQSHYVEDKKAFVALKEGQDRIKSMALIHERFYQNDGLSKIDFDDYIKRLVENLFLSFSISPDRIKSTVEADKISLDIDTAVPCGLIINELVSNALKHAFLPEKPGQLFVSLKYLDSTQVRLTVKDDGIGLPAGFDVTKYDSLGMQLINALSNQLDGKLTTIVDNGTTFQLDFAVPNHG
jgi:PAS domain S-box-containing protein